MEPMAFIIYHDEVIAITLNLLGLCSTIWMAQEKMIKPKEIMAYPLQGITNGLDLSRH
jgi:hypothetical protein